MLFVDLLFALAIALFFTVIFTVLGRRKKPWNRLIVFFLIIFFSAWAGGVWIAPAGDISLGIYWLSFFVTGLIFALVLETVAAFSPRSSQIDNKEMHKEEEELETALGTYFWILILAFIVLIIVGYIHRLF